MISPPKGSIIFILKIPILTTLSAIDLIEEKNPLYFGRPGLYARRHSNIIIQECDLLICIGAGLHYETTGYNLHEFSKKSKKIIIDIDKSELKKNVTKNGILINVDCNLFGITTTNGNFAANKLLQILDTDPAQINIEDNRYMTGNMTIDIVGCETQATLLDISNVEIASTIETIFTVNGVPFN